MTFFFLLYNSLTIILGAPETSVTNLSCVTRITISSTVSLFCTWLPGQGAPEDTKYFLFYRLVFSPILVSNEFL